MALTALTVVPTIVATEAIIDESIADGIVGVFTFRTKYPDPPAEVRAVVGPLSAADMIDPAIGVVAIIDARDAVFAALPDALDSSALALL